jgi:hypothetical protein
MPPHTCRREPAGNAIVEQLFNRKEKTIDYFPAEKFYIIILLS